MANQRIVPAVLSGIVALSVLAGCAKSDNTAAKGGSPTEAPKKQEAAATTAAKQEPVSLDYWAAWSPNSDEETKTKAQIKKFEEAHPNIKINVQLITFDVLHDKLIAAINAGNAPDLSWG